MTHPEDIPEEASSEEGEPKGAAAPAVPPVEPDDLVDAADEHPAEDDDDDRGLLGGWLYLLLLFIVFLLLALLAYGCDDDSDGGATGDRSGASASGPETEATDGVALTVVVDGDQVTLRGMVPDAATRDQLVALAEARYPDGTVVDELSIDAGLALVGGTISVEGTTDNGDDRPAGLLADAQAALGLAAASFDVSFAEVERSAMDVNAEVGANGVSLRGSLPDESIYSGVVSAAEEQWGAGNVDTSGLTVDGQVTLDGGQFRIDGTVDAGDVRASRFAAALADFGIDANADAVEINTSADALARLEDRLRTQLEANPILFALGSAEIDPASDSILQDSAAAITAAPGIAVEIVGHTDSTGSAEANLALSEERANAVMERLIEIGVDPDRLTARGAGAAEPVADNETEEGRAANRRIAFEFEGATDPASDGAADEATEQEE